MPRRRARRKLAPLERVAEQRQEEGEGPTSQTSQASQASQTGGGTQPRRQTVLPTLRLPVPGPSNSSSRHSPFRKTSGSWNLGSESRPSWSTLDNMAAKKGAGLTVPALQVRRRSRPLFATFGKRVSAMVKVKMAFSRKNRLEDVFEKDEGKMAAIHELPTQPRFSSYLSPEAQFALLKCYEDELHARLSSSHPEYRALLQRNQTPHHLVGIRRRQPFASPPAPPTPMFPRDPSGVDFAPDPRRRGRRRFAAGRERLDGGLTDDEDDDEDEDYDDDDDIEAEEEETRKKKEEQEKEKEEKEKEKEQKEKGEEQGDAAVAKATPASAAAASAAPAGKTGAVGTLGQGRSRSLPPLVPRQRRLVLTYRLESAMDILDTLRRKKGYYALSPRVLRQSRQIAPVRDYHSWMKVWSKEFSTGLKL